MTDRPTKEELKGWLLWLAIPAGSMAVFSFGFFYQLPEAVVQVFGTEMISLALRDVLSWGAFCFLAGRLFVLFASDTIFAIFRVVVLQFLLQPFRFLSFKWRRKGFIWVSKFRRWVDALQVVILENPNEAAAVFGGSLFSWVLVNDWIMLLVVTMILLTIVFLPSNLDRQLKKMRLPFRFREFSVNSSTMRKFSFSTAILCFAFFAGLFSIQSMFSEATVVRIGLETKKAVVVGHDFVLLVESEAQRVGDVKIWKFANSQDLLPKAHFLED